MTIIYGMEVLRDLHPRMFLCFLSSAFSESLECHSRIKKGREEGREGGREDGRKEGKVGKEGREGGREYGGTAVRSG